MPSKIEYFLFSSQFQLGTNNFTIECWVYFNSVASSVSILNQQSSPSNTSYNIYIGTSGTLSYYLSSNGSSWNIASGVSMGTIAVGNWYHVALVRNGTTFTPYLNGVAGTTTTSSASIFASTAALSLGADGASVTSVLNGYISNFRLVNGTAVYTTSFTPPTSPVTAITNTSLLLNFTNAGIYDASVQNNEITVGSAQASTTVYKWSPTSMKFNGTTDYLTTVDKPQLQFGTGNFTIEGWFYLSTTGQRFIISKRSTGSTNTGWHVWTNVLSKLVFSSAGPSSTSLDLVGATTLSSATWYYFAVVRSGTATGNVKIYLNGSVDATSPGAVNDNFNQTFNLLVGVDSNLTSYFNGYLQDIRLTNGIARTITTPTAAFPTR
jgi:hypothetical protein